MKKCDVWLISSKYNYPDKFAKAVVDGNIKYIEKLIKNGKVIKMEADAHVDECGNFCYATLKPE